MAAALLATACGDSDKNFRKADFGGRLTKAEKQEGVFTPEVMWKMGRVGGSQLSPDGQTVVFTVTYYDMSENSGKTGLYVMPYAGGDVYMLAGNEHNNFDPNWNADGSAIYFLSDRTGDAQVWSIKPDGTELKQISDVKDGIEGYGIAAAGNRAFYAARTHVVDRLSADMYPDMDKSKAFIYNDLMARHWDYWDNGHYMHIFVSDIEDGKFGAGEDIMPEEPWDAPMAPYFDMGEIAWNHAGTQLAYTCKKLKGLQYAVSTDSDIYLYDVASKTTKNINKANRPENPLSKVGDIMPGYDRYPVFSPDDTKIAFRSMARPGNESDIERLFIYTIDGGDMRNLTEGFEHSAENVLWVDNSNIMFIAGIQGTIQICSVDLSDSPVVITRSSGDHDVVHMSIGGGNCLAEVTRISQASELFSFNNDQLTQISFVNKEIYDNVRMGDVQKRWITTTDGKQMLTWVILPPNFDANAKYPALLYCQGGPQSIVSQFWSYRWNFQLMASQGYVVVAPNRRGVPSFGQAWLDQISGDYYGQNIRDYLSAIDSVSAESWVDNDRLGCVGASYGGYSAFFLAGNHNKRFKAFIAHCGIFNFESMYGSTEELFFINNDYGGPYWDKANAVAQASYANSPHKFVSNWDTPILIITGLRDFRIPYTQSLEAFTAARVRGIPARLVAFENEAHQVFKPQNSIVWNREFFGWLDMYLKEE